MHSVYKNIIDSTLLQELRSWADSSTPARGNFRGGYWHSSSGLAQPELDQWWTPPVDPSKIEFVTRVLEADCLPGEGLRYYSADCVCAEPGFAECRPHVDTPYRFEPWQGADRGLGAQYIVPLEPTSWQNGSTGLMLGSEHYTWPIESCYAGRYTDLFEANVTQMDMLPGDVLYYDPRMLHSTMPNYSQHRRWVLLVSYIHQDIWDQVRELDEAVG